MIRLEVHPGEGGADAATFAGELASAIAKHAGTTSTFEGGAHIFHRL